MNHKIRLYGTVTLLALFMAGCSGPCDRIDPVTAPTASGGSADLTTYVAIGTTISAGFQSGGLVETHQAHAFPALFARQIGTQSFTYPRISPDGIPPLLQLVSLGSSPVISNEGRTLGSPRDLLQPTPYHNMAVPQAFLYDADSTTYYYANPFGRPSTFFDIIVRHQGSILQQVAALSPTFVSFEYGASEVLGPVLVGSGTPAFDVTSFGAILHYTLDDLEALAPGVSLALFNVPDPTSLPFVTTIKPYVVNPADGSHIPLVGPGPALLSEDDYVLLTAADSLAVGTGVPTLAGGNGRPLLGEQVLSASELATLQAAVDGYNAAITAEAATRGAALVDLQGLLREAATTGIEVQGVRYTSAFVTGGLFSLDGVHPNDLAHGLVANAMIEAVNARFGASIPYVNLRDAASITSARARQAPEEGGQGWPRIEGLRAALHAGSPAR